MIGIRDGGVKIVTTDLKLWYDISQKRSYSGSGTTVTDLSSGGYNGTLTNGPTYSNDNGGIINLDGSNDYILSSGSVNLGSLRNDQFTIGVWVYVNSISDNTMLVMLSTEAVGDSGLYIRTNGVITLYIAAFNSQGSTGNSTYSTGTWQNIVVTYNRNVSPTTSFYVNNTKTTVSVGSSPTFLGSSIPISIGGPSRLFVSNYLNGKIGQVLIYGRALSDTEVGQNYNANKSRFNFDIVFDSLIMHLDASNISSYPASGTTWNDLSGNGNGGNLIYGNFDAGNGGALWFNQLGASGGNPDYFYKADNSTIRFGSPNFSFGCWFYWPNTGNVSSAAMGKRWDGSGNFAQWALRIGNGDFSGLTTGKKIGALFIPDTGSPNTSISADLPNQATWVHVFVVIATTQQKVYLNGIDSATTNTNLTGKTFNITNRKLVVGGLNDNTDNNLLLSWGFKTACFYLYNRNLSAQEVLQNYNATRLRFGL